MWVNDGQKQKNADPQLTCSATKAAATAAAKGAGKTDVCWSLLRATDMTLRGIQVRDHLDRYEAWHTASRKRFVSLPSRTMLSRWQIVDTGGIVMCLQRYRGLSCPVVGVVDPCMHIPLRDGEDV